MSESSEDAWRAAVTQVCLLELWAGGVLVAVLLLDLALWALGARGEAWRALESFEPYLDEVARHATSLSSLAVYGVLLVCYAVGVEWVLRCVVQERLVRRSRAMLGAALAVGLYTMIHARYGWVPGVYGFGVGLVGAWSYWRRRDWRVLALWHVQWDGVAVSAVLLWAALGPGPPRDAVNLAYKATLVEAGRLQHHADHGWVDVAHYYGAQRRLCEVVSRLGREVVEGEQLEVLGRFERLDGVVVVHRSNWRALGDVSDAMEAGAALVWEVAVEEESFQERAPWWSGLPLSAWSFEDLPSVSLALDDALSQEDFLGRCEGLEQVARSGLKGAVLDSRQGLALWSAEGRGLVGELRKDVAGVEGGASWREARGVWERVD